MSEAEEGIRWKFMERSDENWREGHSARMLEDRDVDCIAVYHSDAPERVILEIKVPVGAKPEVFHRCLAGPRGVESDHLFVGYVTEEGGQAFFEFSDKDAKPIFHRTR